MSLLRNDEITGNAYGQFEKTMVQNSVFLSQYTKTILIITSSPLRLLTAKRCFNRDGSGTMYAVLCGRRRRKENNRFLGPSEAVCHP